MKPEAYLISQPFTTYLSQLKLRASKSTTNVKDVHAKPQFHLSKYKHFSEMAKGSTFKHKTPQISINVMSSQLRQHSPPCQTHSGHLTVHGCRPVAGPGRSWECGRLPPPPGLPAPWPLPAGVGSFSERSQMSCWSQPRGPLWSTAAATWRRYRMNK